MITKIGVVGVGVLAGLAAVAPLASAGESHGDHHGHGSSTCSVAGGEAGALNNGKVDGVVAAAVTQAPIGGANIADITCSPFLNDNLKNNLNGNQLNLLSSGSELPGTGSLPSFPSL